MGANKGANKLLIGKWVPAKIQFVDLTSGDPSPISFLLKDETKTGLAILYPWKIYANPPILRLLTTKDLLKKISISESSNRYTIEDNNLYYIVRVKDDGSIHVLPPNKPKRTLPKYRLIIVATQYRITAVGGMTKAYFSHEPLYTTSNLSTSGRHGIDYDVFIIPFFDELSVLVKNVSSRGNIDETVYVITPDATPGTVVSKPRYQILDEKAYNDGWVSTRTIYDHWHKRCKHEIELRYHTSYKTDARTDHEIHAEPQDAIEYVESTIAMGKTHWSEIYEVKPPAKIIIKTIRISNRGIRRNFETTIRF